MPEKTDCFGTIFPDLSRLEWNIPQRGQVFAVTVSSQGIGVQGRDIFTDQEAWEKCQQCRDFRSCYDLSMGKMALESAVHVGF
jgi:hypothetical protein